MIRRKDYSDYFVMIGNDTQDITADILASGIAKDQQDHFYEVIYKSDKPSSGSYFYDQNVTNISQEYILNAISEVREEYNIKEQARKYPYDMVAKSKKFLTVSTLVTVLLLSVSIVSIVSSFL